MKYLTSQYLPDSYRLARNELHKAGCKCRFDSVICLEPFLFPEWLNPEDLKECNDFRDSHPAGLLLHAYCIGCQKRCRFITSVQDAFYVSPQTRVIIADQIGDIHGDEFIDVSPWLRTVRENPDIFRDPQYINGVAYLHKVYCRRCRKVYDVYLGGGHQVTSAIFTTEIAWY